MTNVCVSRWEIGGPPIWCTQNATSGEEYRRGWHPEKFDPAANAGKAVLIVGAGPAGMEAATVLGKRGFAAVHLVDAAPAMGGHLRWMTTMPGLGTWRRVTEYRERQIAKLPTVEFIPNLTLDAAGIWDYGADIVIMATGSHWSGDGINPVLHPAPGDGQYQRGRGGAAQLGLNLHQVLYGSGVYATHVAISTWIGSGAPEAEADAIAATYWDLYQKRDRAEVNYVV